LNNVKLKYTAFIDILGFSNYISNHITNDIEAKFFYESINNKLIEYFQYIKFSRDKFTVDEEFNNNIFIDYTWISDTFVITIEYSGKNKNKNTAGIMIFILTMAISNIYHFFAKEYNLLLRGAISSKYTFINDKVLLGKGISEAAKLEKEIAIYPRVIFADDIITQDIMKSISLHHNDNNLNIISKDCDGYYFINYIGALQDLPPMINISNKKNNGNSDKKIETEKLEMIKTYRQIAYNGIQNKNLSIRGKYKWLQNYIERLLPMDGKKHNMFAYNILSTTNQEKLKKTTTK